MLRDGESLINSWDPAGRVLWLCLSLSFFVPASLDELFAWSSGVIHPVHCLTRQDVAFFHGGQQLPYLRWRRCGSGVTKEIRFDEGSTGAHSGRRSRPAIGVQSRRRRRGSDFGVVVVPPDFAR